MLKTTMGYTLSTVICAFFAIAGVSHNGNDNRTSTLILLNGQPTNVHFNDGDTFKILDGQLKLARVRVVGINALETYGPVHKWLNSSGQYLLSIANLATQTAQAGSWSCTTNTIKDTYGRLLATCDDLSLALIAAGLAHAYSVDASPAPINYLNKQKDAQRDLLGMWKNGLPTSIITSLHSADERINARDERSYNRLISTEDGHSEKWLHNKNYGTCENVCLDDDSSCMVYVRYEHRYGNNKPECLKAR